MHCIIPKTNRVHAAHTHTYILRTKGNYIYIWFWVINKFIILKAFNVNRFKLKFIVYKNAGGSNNDRGMQCVVFAVSVWCQMQISRTIWTKKNI